MLFRSNRYPDRDAVKLRSSLSEYINGENNLNLKFENIWVANGSNEILQTLVLACGQGGVLGFTPSYSMHPIITKVCGATWISGVRNDDFTLDVEKAKSQIRSTKPSIIFVTTPNNPTGTSLKLSEIKSLAAEALTSRSLLVVDEAYAEFSVNDSAVEKNTRLSKIRWRSAGVNSVAEALLGARYIVAERIADDADIRGLLRQYFERNALVVSQVKKEFKEQLDRNLASGTIGEKIKDLEELKRLIESGKIRPSFAELRGMIVNISPEMLAQLDDRGSGIE